MAKSPSPEVAEIIRFKKAQYGRFVDTKQFSRMHEIALPEARFAFFEPDGNPITVGKKPNIQNSLAEYNKNIGNAVAAGETVHIFGHGELEQVSSDEVTAIFSMQEMFKLKGAMGLIYSQGGGHYVDTWKRKGDDWFLADLRLERTIVNKSLLFIVANYILTIAAMFGVDLAP